MVSRLDPALRQALLQALSNLSPIEEDDDEETTDESTTDETSTDAPTTGVELLITGDESTTTEAPTTVLKDQIPSVQYHSYVVDNGDTESTFDNEIIRTVIVKAADKQLSDNKINDDEDDGSVDNTVDGKQIDPIKDTSFAIDADNVQVARSVSGAQTNEINAEDEQPAEKKKSTKDASPTTTLSTKKAPKFTTTTTTSTTTTTTTEAPTHNEDGENIEQVLAEEVSISQAPLVTAFTIQQDILGRPNNVIPLAFNQVPPPVQQQPAALFNFVPSQSLVSALPSTMQPPTTLPAQQFRSNNNANNAFAADPILVQKQLELEQQVAYLQQQQRNQEVIFRDQQQQFDRNAAQRQQQLLHEQRLRIEEDYRLKQLAYEQEIRAFRNQQQQNEARKNIQLKHLQFVEQHRQQLQQQQQQFVQAPPAVQQQQQFHNNAPAVATTVLNQSPVFVQHLPNLQQQHNFQSEQQQQHQQQRSNFHSTEQLQQQPQQQQPQQQQQQQPQQQSFTHQIIPSVSFASTLATQQLLPAKNHVDFQQSQQIALQFQAVPFNPPQQQLQTQQQQIRLLPTAQELPQRQFQSFQSPQQQQRSASSSAAVDVLPSVSAAFPIVEETHHRNRVFRQESGVGNFGFNHNNDGQSNRFLQSFLHNAGIAGISGGGGRQTEDFNIITKVLALNHGIPNARTFNGQQF